MSSNVSFLGQQANFSDNNQTDKLPDDVLKNQGWINSLNMWLIIKGFIFFVFFHFWVKTQSSWSRYASLFTLFGFYLSLIGLLIFKSLASIAGEQYSENKALNLLGYAGAGILQVILFVLMSFLLSLLARSGLPWFGYFNNISIFTKETPGKFAWIITALPLVYFLFSNIYISVIFFALATFMKSPSSFFQNIYPLDLSEQVTDPSQRIYSFFLVPILTSILGNSVYSTFTRQGRDITPGMTLVTKCIQVIILLAVLMIGKSDGKFSVFGLSSSSLFNEGQNPIANIDNLKHKTWILVGILLVLSLLEIVLPDNITRFLLPGINYSQTDDAKASMFTGTYNAYILLVSVVIFMVHFFIKNSPP